MASLVYDASSNIIQTVSTSQTAGVVQPLINAAVNGFADYTAANTGSGVILNNTPIVFSGNYQGSISNPA